MTMDEKVGEVTALFAALDSEIASFQQRTTLHCQWGCGKCCLKPDIEATILEFLPFAHALWKGGEAEAWHDKLQTSEEAICAILNPTQSGAGHCSRYPHRGLICRLFGYSARTNKYGEKEIITCAIIKTEQEGAFVAAGEAVKKGAAIPGMSDYYTRLRSIDFELSREMYPVNVAIRKAIEMVMHYYAYRDVS